jgi:hypothetical protein
MSMFHARFLLGLLFQPQIQIRHVPPKRRLTFKGIHSVVSQMIELLKTLLAFNGAKLQLLANT